MLFFSAFLNKIWSTVNNWIVYNIYNNVPENSNDLLCIKNQKYYIIKME